MRRDSDGEFSYKFKKIKYESYHKGDKIDKMLAHYVNTHNIYIPIRRLEEKIYFFGTKKVTIVIINGALAIRVGGGYMDIEEYVSKHALSECNILKAKMKKEHRRAS